MICLLFNKPALPHLLKKNIWISQNLGSISKYHLMPLFIPNVKLIKWIHKCKVLFGNIMCVFDWVLCQWFTFPRDLPFKLKKRLEKCLMNYFAHRPRVLPANFCEGTLHYGINRVMNLLCHWYYKVHIWLICGSCNEEEVNINLPNIPYSCPVKFNH